MSVDLTPYPAMKDSGVPWLGEVPKHWSTQPLKRWVTINAEVLPETTVPDRVFRYVDIGSVGTGILTQKPQRLRFAGAPSRARRVVHNGDTLVSTVRTYLKAIYFVDGEEDQLVCSTGFAVLTPRAGTVSQFVSYLARSSAFTDRVMADSVGIAYPAVAESRLGSFHVAVPPLPEQAAIVRFLDHADRRIRRYICVKQKLITLLEEQKQALIHQAVTGQIDICTDQVYPAYKDSDVEWLGEVPAHWEVRRCGGVFREVVDTGYTDAELLSIDRFMGVVRQTETGRKQRASEDRLTYKRVRPGQLAYNLMNAFMGSIGVSALDGILSPAYAVAEPLGQIDTCFFHHLLRTPLYTGQFYRYSYGIMYERNRLYFDRFRQIPLLVPPYVEQKAIVVALTAALAEFSRRVECLDRQIQLVTEYRTRLIADVVTGKLDVREAAARLPDEVEEPEPLDVTDALTDGEDEPADDLDAATRGGRGVTTDTSERGLERLICTALTGSPCDAASAQAGPESEVAAATGGVGWICGAPNDYDREYTVDLGQFLAFLIERSRRRSTGSASKTTVRRAGSSWLACRARSASAA